MNIDCLESPGTESKMQLSRPVMVMDGFLVRDDRGANNGAFDAL